MYNNCCMNNRFISLKKKNKFLGTFVVIIFLFVTAYFYYDDEGITHSEPVWKCEYKKNTLQCLVSFDVENKSHTHQYRKVSIRGVIIPRDGKLSSLKICGEKLIDLEIAPRKTVTINEMIPVKKKPNEVKINIWE